MWIEGELSNLHKHRSGHWYFSLKDSGAQVSCAMFASSNRRVRIPIKDGDAVLVRGRVSLYEARGTFQVIVDHLEPAGEGALRAAFEQLKQSLAREGLFEESRKQPIPQRPSRIAVISSATGAALRDFLHTVERRYRAVDVILLPVRVQGDQAGPEIVAALEQLAAIDVDVAVLTRGGGSIEDLWAFNLEPVARAIAACPVPLVSAIGHQVDFTIADFAADLRAATPTAAAELITPDGAALIDGLRSIDGALTQLIRTTLSEHRAAVRERSLRLTDPRRELAQQMRSTDERETRLHRAAARLLEGHRETLANLTRRLQRQSLDRRLAAAQDTLADRNIRLRQQIQAQVNRSRDAARARLRTLDAVSPAQTLERGYAAVLSDTGSVVDSADQLQPGDRVEAYLRRGKLTLEVQDVDLAASLTRPPPPSDGGSEHA